MKATKPEDIENLRQEFAAFLIATAILASFGAAVVYAMS